MEKIIVIDDDPDIVTIATRRLKAAGYEVMSAPDGEAGLRLVAAEQPSVVLLDLMMPKMHGFAVCQEIRKDASLDATRIIVSSAKSYPVDVAKAKELGADVGINYKTTPDWEEKIREITRRRGVDHIIEVGGGETLPESVRAARFGGHIALIGNLTGRGGVHIGPIFMKGPRGDGSGGEGRGRAGPSAAQRSSRAPGPTRPTSSACSPTARRRQTPAPPSRSRRTAPTPRP